MRILIVEDNDILAENLADALTESNYVADIVHDGESAFQQVKMVNYDLILLDILLPKLDGISLSQLLRQKGYQIPILIMTAKDTSADQIKGLDAGADDYLVKPFDLGVLLARIRALLRRETTKNVTLHWKDLSLNPNTYQVTYKNKPLYLTPKELAIVEYLLRNHERVIPRRDLLDNIWSFNDPPTEEAVKAHIKGIRRKLEQVGAPKDFIKTIHGIGYYLQP